MCSEVSKVVGAESSSSLNGQSSRDENKQDDNSLKNNHHKYSKQTSNQLNPFERLLEQESETEGLKVRQPGVESEQGPTED